VIFSTAGVFIISILLLFTRGGEFVPESDMGFLQLIIDRSPGTSLEAMETSVKQLNDILAENVPENEVIYTNFGQGEGVFAFFSSAASNQGDVVVRLTSRTQRKRSMNDIEADIRDKVTSIPDLEVRFGDRGEEAFMGGGGDIVIEIFGHDLTISEALANEITNKIKNIDGVASTEISIEESAPELKIQLDRQRIADLGLSTAQI
jgi:HAE1 family hydrophobic/amphiphilic exporter-1